MRLGNNKQARERLRCLGKKVEVKVSISFTSWRSLLNLYVRIEDLRESKSRTGMGEIQQPVNYKGGSRVIYVCVI